MQEQHLFEYAVIRVVPKVEREEFLNVGVILYARSPRFLEVRFGLPEARLQAFAPALDLSEVRAHLHSLQKICAGAKDAGPIGRLDAASRFRWLTATRSTVVQTSKVHPGLCASPANALEKLYAQLAG